MAAFKIWLCKFRNPSMEALRQLYILVLRSEHRTQNTSTYFSVLIFSLSLSLSRSPSHIRFYLSTLLKSNNQLGFLELLFYCVSCFMLHVCPILLQVNRISCQDNVFYCDMLAYTFHMIHLYLTGFGEPRKSKPFVVILMPICLLRLSSN